MLQGRRRPRLNVNIHEVQACLYCGALYAGPSYLQDHEDQCSSRAVIALNERPRQQTPLLGAI